MPQPESTRPALPEAHMPTCRCQIDGQPGFFIVDGRLSETEILPLTKTSSHSYRTVIVQIPEDRRIVSCHTEIDNLFWSSTGKNGIELAVARCQQVTDTTLRIKTVERLLPVIACPDRQTLGHLVDEITDRLSTILQGDQSPDMPAHLVQKANAAIGPSNLTNLIVLVARSIPEGAHSIDSVLNGQPREDQ